MIKLKKGIYDITNEEYHGLKALGSSNLVWGLRSMAHLKEHSHFGNSTQTPRTHALTFGSGSHKLLLEPESLYDEFDVPPSEDDYQDFDIIKTNDQLKDILSEHELKVSGNKDALIERIKDNGLEGGLVFWSDVMDEFNSRLNGRESIPRKDFTTMESMVKALRDFYIVGSSGKQIPMSHIFKNGEAEKSYIWQDSETGIWCRVRTDWIIKDIIIDYKTARDAREYAFRKEVAHRAYYMRAAFYLDGVSEVTGVPMNKFVFVAQEKEAPYCSAAYSLTADDLDLGRRLYRQILTRTNECIDSGVWPGYSNRITPIEIPPYEYEKEL